MESLSGYGQTSSASDALYGCPGLRCRIATRSDDLDPAHRMVRVRAEVAKGSRERVVPYSATTGEPLLKPEAPCSSRSRQGILPNPLPSGPGRKSSESWRCRPISH